MDAVCTLGRRFVHIRRHTKNVKCQLSAYFKGGKRFNVMAKNMSEGLKNAAAALEYPTVYGIPIERVDTHLLRSGGANALSLSGYSDRQIQKMGRWRGETFKEYIREEIANFTVGMSRDMKTRFNFVNVAGGAYHDVTDSVIVTDYQAAAAA